MSHAAAEPADVLDHDHFGSASTGKIAMWIFLTCDALSFGGLLLGYGILRGGAKEWPNPTAFLGINFTAGMTFLLICSSVTMVLSLAAAHEKKRSQTAFFLALTILGGVLFLAGQAYEYTHLVHEKHMSLSGMNLPAPLVPQFASTFFIITGFHGCHVFTGVLYLSIILVQTLRGQYDEDSNNIEIAGLFWHFVDLVWILVFTFVYLIP